MVARALLISALALGITLPAVGCGGGSQEPETVERVDEEAQTVRRDLRLIRQYCRSDRDWSRRATRRVERDLDRRAERLANIAWDDDDGTYESQYWGREMLADLATFMDEKSCLPATVRRIDYFLRNWVLAEPSYPEEDYPEPEPPSGRFTP